MRCLAIHSWSRAKRNLPSTIAFIRNSKAVLLPTFRSQPFIRKKRMCGSQTNPLIAVQKCMVIDQRLKQRGRLFAQIVVRSAWSHHPRVALLLMFSGGGNAFFAFPHGGAALKSCSVRPTSAASPPAPLRHARGNTWPAPDASAPPPRTSRRRRCGKKRARRA
jgi:hypothetical protein